MQAQVYVKQTIQSTLSSHFSSIIEELYPGLDTFVEVTKATKKNFGHYQLNSAMKLAKALGKNPREIATEILEKAKGISFIEKVEVAGPGFLNIWLSSAFLQELLMSMLKDPKLGVEATKKEKIAIDFSSPNIAKEMHVGHLRSTIIGDCLAKTFEFLGDDVVRINHVGDWGTSFGMLIAYMKQECDDTNYSLSELVAFYKASKQKFDADPEFKKRAQTEVVKLQQGEEEARKLWEKICEISRRAYQEIYDELDIHLIERGESFYNPFLQKTVDELEEKGLVKVSDGAKCIYMDGFKNRDGDPLPLMVQKSDGGFNYDTTDMAAIKHRVEDEKADRLIYVTDQGQATHFQMIFKAAEMAGYVDPEKVRLDHVPFGLVLGPDGKKFKTRSGDTERLIDLLYAAEEKALAIIQEKNPDWSEKEQKEVSKVLGINAIKYSDLSCHRVSDYTFSYDKMLKFEGNTAAFVMYAYVRIFGIERKVGKEISEIVNTAEIILEHPSEIELALHLVRFKDVVNSVCDELMPHRYTEYLFELAEHFNAFFRDCRVEGSDAESSRLLLVEVVRRVFKQGLSLLGLSTVERM